MSHVYAKIKRKYYRRKISFGKLRIYLCELKFVVTKKSVKILTMVSYVWNNLVFGLFSSFKTKIINTTFRGRKLCPFSGTIYGKRLMIWAG